MSAVRYMSGPSNRPLRCTPVGPDRIHGVARSPGRRTSPPQPSCCSESSDFDETMIPSPSPKINNSPHNTVALHIHQAHRTPRSTYFTAPPAPPFLQLVRSQLKCQEQGSPHFVHPNIYRTLHACSPSNLDAFAHVSQLQLKASLSLHCVTNRGLPFLFEMVVGKTAWNKGRCMINHIAVC